MMSMVMMTIWRMLLKCINSIEKNHRDKKGRKRHGRLPRSSSTSSLSPPFLFLLSYCDGRIGIAIVLLVSLFLFLSLFLRFVMTIASIVAKCNCECNCNRTFSRRKLSNSPCTCTCPCTCHCTCHCTCQWLPVTDDFGYSSCPTLSTKNIINSTCTTSRSDPFSLFVARLYEGQSSIGNNSSTIADRKG